jgi:LemA protein
MKGFLIGVGVVVGLGVLLVLYYMGAYNGLVGKQEAVNNSWAQVQTQYQRRGDLVPQLVATVKGVANFEKSTLTAVVEARAKVGTMQVNKDIVDDPEAMKKFDAAQGQLTGALSRLMVVVEKYPELKATSNFSELQSQLEGTENRIAVARRDFNATVQDYNVGIRTMPTSIIANMSGFRAKAYFESAAGNEKAPIVNF